MQAYSGVGFGDKTYPLKVHTKAEKPIPVILASIDEGISKIDMDLLTSELVVHTGSTVQLLTSIEHEKKLYWIDENNHLMSYDNSIKVKLTSIPSEVLALSVDWIDRVLYWSQRQHKGSVVFALDLNSVEIKPTDPKFIMDRTGLINSLIVSPIDRLLYWVETTDNDQNNGVLMTKSLDDDKIEPFFDDASLMVHKNIALDTSSDNTINIIWTDINSQLFATDVKFKHSMPLDIIYDAAKANLAKDSGRLYWTENNAIYACSIYASDHSEYVMNAPNVHKLFAFFHQNYLERECMTPLQQYNGRKYIPELIQGNERSLVIRLPEIEVHPNCNRRKPPGIRYTILYGSAGNDVVRNCTFADCNVVKSFNEVETITDLKPFVRYKFQVGVNNYYGERMDTPMIFGPMVRKVIK